MSAELPIKLGAPVKLHAQETTKDATKIVRATLYNMADWSVLASSIALSHVANGVYEDDSFVFPVAVSKIFAQYLVFDSDGTTPNTTGDQAVNDVFFLDELDAGIAEIKSAVQGADLIAEIDEGEMLVAEILEDQFLSAEIDETFLFAEICEDINLVAEVITGDDITGVVQC